MSDLETITGSATGSGAPSGLESITGGAPKAATPAAAAPAGPAGPATSTPASKLEVATSTPAIPMAQPASTTGIFNNFLKTNNFSTSTAGSTSPTVAPPANSDATPLGIAKNTFAGLPAASEKVSNAINDTLINKPADLLANTKYMQQASEGISEGSTAGLFAQNLLQKLSIGLNTVTGLTGGAYQAPKETQGNSDLLDKGLTILTQGLGAAAGIGALGKVTAGVPVVGAGINGISNLVGKLPLVGKYIAPFVKPLAENATGFAEYGQLDPKLADDMKARGKTLLVDIGGAPLYTALGAIKNSGISNIASFTLGFGMAKLSGASNQDAVISGLSFSFLDAFGRMDPNAIRGKTPSEVQADLENEARQTLQPYADSKLTANSSDAELKAAFRAAVHVTHPDVGGSQQQFVAIKNAYDLLSKGGAGNNETKPTTEAENSVGQLSGAVRDSIEQNGEMATHQAIKEQLGLDDTTSTRLLLGAKTPRTPEEIQQGHDKIASQILGTRSDEQITSDALNHFEQNKDDLVQKYIAKFGNHVGADEAKELMPGYAQDRSISDLVAKGAGKLTEAVYDHQLEAQQGKKNNTVLMTAGGTGVGKSTALRGGGIDTGKYPILFDSNSSNAGSTINRIQKALDNGFKVEFHFVYAPIDKAYDRVLDRAHMMTEELGSGRPVSPQGHIDMHHGAADSAPEVIKHFAGNKNVEFFAHDNSGVESKPVSEPLAFIEKVRDNKGDENQLHADLTKQREAALHEGRISERANKAFERANKLRPQKESKTVQRLSEQGNKEPSKDVLKSLTITSTGKERTWTRALADTALGQFKSSIEKNGFNAEIVGSVAEKGKSSHDLDVLLTPKDGEMPTVDSTLKIIDAIRQEYPIAQIDEDIIAFQTPEGRTFEIFLGNLPGQAEQSDSYIDFINNLKGAVNERIDEDIPFFKGKSILRSPGGFVNPGQAATDIAAGVKVVKDTVEHLENVRELTGDVREGIYQHENARKAARVRLTKLIENVGNLLDANGWEQLYHYDENKNEKLTPEQKEIYEKVIMPLKQTLTDVITQYKEEGGTITPDLFFMENEQYTPRFAKDKQSALDKLIEQGKKAVKSIQNGGLLSQSLGTVSKERKFYAATDSLGKRTVVYVPTDKSENVLEFKGNKVTDLGPVKGAKTPKIKEFFDDSVMRKLNDLADSLGITHKRQVGPIAGMRTAAGVSFGKDLIMTRLSPSSVLAHELGHAIDNRYGLQAVMKEDTYGAEHKSQILAEMRALADTRFEGMETTPSFQKYVRKGSEKMAVMFEAYVANREMFRDVAPHLYDDFRDFLASHDELKPFLDIQPTVQLGSNQHGGEQSGKIGKTFVDAKGKRYTLGQATTKEIEQNTKTEYHKNVLANYVVALDRAQNALNAMKLLERIKNEREFGEIIRKDSPDEAAPDGWKSVSDLLPQFRGYHMEPRVAEALTDLAKRQQGKTYYPIFDEVNNLLTTAIVLNPIMHVPNVIAGRSVAAAAGDISRNSFTNLHTAFNEVRNKGPLYLEYLEHGAPFMALKETTKSFADAILTQYAQELEDHPGEHSMISDILGYTNPKAMAAGFKKINEGITWGSNDILFMHALLDYADVHPEMSKEAAIREVSKRMADYRIPERILLPGAAGRALSIGAQSRVFMFARFHYSGVIKPWLEAARDGATGSGADRINGLRALGYMLIMGILVWPYINKMWQGMTGSNTSYESMPGPLRLVQVGQKLAQQGVPGIPTALQSVFSPSPALKSALELGFNNDFFNRNPIYGPLPAEGLSTYGTSLISPLSSASRMTPEDFTLSMFGVWTPKNVEAKTTLEQMKYDELPALQTQVKKDISAGNVAKAQSEITEFNTRAVATWNHYQVEIGGKQVLTTDAEKQAFLKQWGIKMPGVKAQTNANALYGDGSLTSKSSLLSSIATYAKAIGVSPSEAFRLVFSGQQIARVENFGLFNPDSAIIVQRAPLSVTSQIKDAQETAQGDVSGDGLQLDHVIPLEGGGTNDVSNLNLITTTQDGGEQQQFEDTLGKAVKTAEISQAKVREFSIRYKVGKGETLSPEMMKEFTDKYGGKPITYAEVVKEIKDGTAK